MLCVFRPIDYSSDPLANDAANLVLEQIYKEQPRDDSAAHYQTIVANLHNYCLEEPNEARILAAGSLDLWHTSLGVSELRNIVVAPEVRGQGVGKFLVARLEEKALAGGLDTIRVSSTTGAVGFYTHLGYKAVGDFPLELAKRLD